MRPWIWFTTSGLLSVGGIAWASSIAWRFPEQTDRQLWLSHPMDMIGSMVFVVFGLVCVLCGQRSQDVEDAATSQAERRSCNNDDCGWVGSIAETVHPKHVPEMILCPRCNETTESV